MKKKIKIIDILCKINCDEEVPYKIRYDNKDYTYDSEVQNYWDDNYDYLFERLFCENETKIALEKEVEILDGEDEFEDIEEIIGEVERDKTLSHDRSMQGIVNNFNLIIERTNLLIKNQKKIIEILKED